MLTRSALVGIVTPSARPRGNDWYFRTLIVFWYQTTNTACALLHGMQLTLSLLPDIVIERARTHHDFVVFVRLNSTIETLRLLPRAANSAASFTRFARFTWVAWCTTKAIRDGSTSPASGTLRMCAFKESASRPRTSGRPTTTPLWVKITPGRRSVGLVRLDG